MKRKLSVILTAALVGVTLLSGCGNSKPAQTTEAPKTEAAAQEKSEGASEAADQSEAAAVTFEKKVFKVGLNNPESHPLCQGIKKFGEILEEKTGGQLSLDIYYGGQLGDKTTQMQSLQTGVLDMYMIMSGTLVDYGAKDLKVFTFPYLFDNLEHARAVQNSEIGKQLIDSIQTSGTKMVGIGTYQESGRNYFFTKKPVSKIADLKGLKVRCQEGSIYLETMETFGASPVSIALSELYSALQTGIVDGAEQPLSGFYTNQFHEICKYYLMDGHEISPNIVLFSEITWNKLSPEEQAVIQEAFDESVTYFNELSDASDEEILQKLKEAGVEIIEPENPEEWREAVTGIYDKYAADYKDIIEEIRAVKY